MEVSCGFNVFEFGEAKFAEIRDVELAGNPLSDNAGILVEYVASFEGKSYPGSIRYWKGFSGIYLNDCGHPYSVEIVIEGFPDDETLSRILSELMSA